VVTAPVAAGQWEFAGWFGGGAFPGLTVDSKTEGRLFLVSDVTGVWRSDDRGENWKFIKQGLGSDSGSAVAIAPSNSNTLYFASERGLFYSTDGGAQWTAGNTLNGDIVFARPASHKPVAVSETSPGKVCVGTSKGKILCSTDYGKNWQALVLDTAYFPSTDAITAVSFFNQDQYLYAATTTGLYAYSFGQSLWTPLLKGKSITDFAVSAASSDVIFAAGGSTILMSSDGGKTWTESKPIPKGTTFRVRLSEDSSGTLSIYVSFLSGSDGGVVVSRDKGQTWVSLDQQMQSDNVGNPVRAWVLPSWSSVLSIAVDPFNKNILYRTDWWGVWRSDDAGVTWTEKIKGAPNMCGTDISFSPNGTLYVANMDIGLLRSLDMGKTYEPVFPKVYSPDTAGHVWRVRAISDQNVILTSSPWNNQINQVAISKDGGQTFQITHTGLPTTRPKVNTVTGTGLPHALVVDPVDANNVYMGIDGDDGGGLFVSKDGGSTWQKSSGQPGSVCVYSGLAVDYTNTSRLYWGAIGTNGGIYTSPDKGLTWKKVFSTSNTVVAITAAPDGAVYAGTYNNGPALYVSRDQGTTWKLLSQFSASGVAVDSVAVSPIDPKIIVASTGVWYAPIPQKIYLSRDAGATWTDISGDLTPTHGQSAMVFTKDGQYLYISRYAGGVYRIKL